MYTSGWPKIQNRFWYSSGSPPCDGAKNNVPTLRSNHTMISATVTTGIANRVRKATTSIIHANTGMRSRLMPGTRMLITVTMKLIAEVVEPMPSRIRPTTQKSGPRPGRNPLSMLALVSGVYPNHPPFGAPPSKKLE